MTIKELELLRESRAFYEWLDRWPEGEASVEDLARIIFDVAAFESWIKDMQKRNTSSG